MRLVWREEALADLADLAGRAPGQARAVVEAMDWMAGVGFSLGRRVSRGGLKERYWSVPPQGVYYYLRGGQGSRELIVTAIRDARRRREPW